MGAKDEAVGSSLPQALAPRPVWTLILHKSSNLSCFGVLPAQGQCHLFLKSQTPRRQPCPSALLYQ